MTGLLESWTTCCAGVGLEPATADPVGRALLGRWREPHRCYHTVKHLTECLAQWQNVEPHWQDAHLAGLALWYHDAVYDPRARDNEACSADLARRDLGSLGLDQLRIDRIAEFVLATDHHSIDGLPDPDTALLLDVDLAILGAAPARYDRYAQDVRLEYAHIPDDAWRAGRTTVLTGFLTRERIFRHPEFAKLEASARENLGREVVGLAAG